MYNRILLFLFNIKGVIISNFFVKLDYIINEDNKYQISNKYPYIGFMHFFPFFITRKIVHLLDYDLIYNHNDIYYSVKNDYENKKTILPIITEFTFTNNDDVEEVDFKTQIKYYNSSLPLWFIIKNNNFEKYKLIRIRYMTKGKMISKTFEILNNLDNKVHNLFANY